MGYYPVNKIKLERFYGPRRIEASFYDETTNKWEMQTFAFDDLDSALEWIADKIRHREM